MAASFGVRVLIVRSQQSFVDVVRDVTDDEGCAVVYEAIGKDTLQDSLDSLRLMGVCAAYGHVSGPPDPIDPPPLKWSAAIVRKRRISQTSWETSASASL